MLVVELQDAMSRGEYGGLTNWQGYPCDPFVPEARDSPKP